MPASKASKASYLRTMSTEVLLVRASAVHGSLLLNVQLSSIPYSVGSGAAWLGLPGWAPDPRCLLGVAVAVAAVVAVAGLGLDGRGSDAQERKGGAGVRTCGRAGGRADGREDAKTARESQSEGRLYTETAQGVS